MHFVCAVVRKDTDYVSKGRDILVLWLARQPWVRIKAWKAQGLKGRLIILVP